MIRRSFVVGSLSLLLIAMGNGDALALALYGARSGRTCDNCHTNPTGWTNPTLSQRKCNLSCLSCHWDPQGGGLRTVPGNFYAQSTLPMFGASHRGYKDWDRWPLNMEVEEERRNKVPDLTWGSPLAGASKMAFDQQRYAGLNADPFLQVGLDIRLAGWFSEGASAFFPMQFDNHLALHPLPHLTAIVTAGVLASSSGVEETKRQSPVYAVKDASIMIHQLPYMGYLRVGRFAPPFGTKLDDHTQPIRRGFELDLGSQHSRVVGVEVGAAPNYPYVHLAAFRPNLRDDLDGDDPFNRKSPPWEGVPGWGAALSAGWRDMGWQTGMSFMTRNRDLQDGGDTRAANLSASFNPWFYNDALPFTLMGEISVGEKQRPYSGSTTTHMATYLEIDCLIWNGVNLRLKHAYEDPDFDLKDDQLTRLSFGIDYHFLPNLALVYEGRMTKDAINWDGLDGILFLHGWF